MIKKLETINSRKRKIENRIRRKIQKIIYVAMDNIESKLMNRESIVWFSYFIDDALETFQNILNKN